MTEKLVLKIGQKAQFMTMHCYSVQSILNIYEYVINTKVKGVLPLMYL